MRHPLSDLKKRATVYLLKPDKFGDDRDKEGAPEDAQGFKAEFKSLSINDLIHMRDFIDNYQLENKFPWSPDEAKRTDLSNFILNILQEKRR